MDTLQRFRDQIDNFMASNPQSPLDADQRSHFTGLNYFEANEALAFEVAVEPLPKETPTVEMETSTGEKRPYRRWGTFTFEVDGTAATLTIYSDLYGYDFFLPFRDATSGDESYGAGRYLDNHRPGLEHIEGNRFYIDFNFAYNPYCAYSEAFSCPLPPFENWLKVPIRAGEKSFKQNDSPATA